MTITKLPARALAALFDVAVRDRHVRHFSARARMAAALCGLFLSALPVPHAEAIGIARSAFVDCQAAYLDNSPKLLKKRTDAILKCSDKLLACSLQDELSTGNFATCSVRVAAACSRGFAALANVENATANKIAVSCGALADYDFGSSVGLGFRRFESECGPILTGAQATACSLSHLRCRAADIAESLYPRTYELFDRAGLLSAHPETTACLDVRAPSPATSGDPIALGICERGLSKTYSRALYKMPRVVSACLGGLLECQLRGDRLNLTLQQPPTCLSSSDNIASCNKAHDGLDVTLGTSILVKAAAACTGVATSDMLSGLGFGALCPGAATQTAIANCARGAAVPKILFAIDEVAPRTCQMSQDSPVNLFTLGSFCAPQCGNNVVEQGETCDDGNLDNLDECTNHCQTGPTTHQSVSIPSSAHPAHTPDGTLANAVEPGSSLETQFGSTIFDLNKATYVR